MMYSQPEFDKTELLQKATLTLCANTDNPWFVKFSKSIIENLQKIITCADKHMS